MVFQAYTSFAWLTVRQNVEYGLKLQGIDAAERRKKAEKVLEQVGLHEFADRYPKDLSGGMKQRVAIARTLVNRPRVVLMDEPFGALDPATRLSMQDLIVGLWRELNATVFLVTHSIEEAVYLGDRVYVMSAGPGRLLKEVKVPPPDRPARIMQREKEFLDVVFELRDLIERLGPGKGEV
jgi:NitT/TauT family transport system ATP-binding protein